MIALIVACTSQNPVITEVVLLKDITDTNIAKPDSNEIISLFGLKNTENGGIFRFTNLTDVSYNYTRETRIEVKNLWLSNEFEREDEIKKFKKDIGEIISNMNKESEGKRNSSIYLPIARALNDLKNSQAQRKIIIIYSDLMENTQELSFYRNKDFERIKGNPEAVLSQFEKMEKLDSLGGIEVRFIFQPKDSRKDQVFRVISGFYKKILKEKGAKVIIGANLE